MRSTILYKSDLFVIIRGQNNLKLKSLVAVFNREFPIKRQAEVFNFLETDVLKQWTGTGSDGEVYGGR